MGPRESRLCSQKPLAVPLIPEGDETCTLSHTLHIALYVQNKGFFIEPWPGVHALDCEDNLSRSPALCFSISNCKQLCSHPIRYSQRHLPRKDEDRKKAKAEALVP